MTSQKQLLIQCDAVCWSERQSACKTNTGICSWAVNFEPDSFHGPLECVCWAAQVRANSPAGDANSLATRLRKLTWLHLGEDMLQHLQALQQCTRLTQLSILCGSLNSLAEHPCALALTQIFQRLRSLTHLYANCGQLPQEQGVAGMFFAALQTLTQLRHLHLTGSVQGVAGVQALAQALSAMPKLQTLKLSTVDLRGEDGARALSALLRNTLGLTQLDIIAMPWQHRTWLGLCLCCSA